ncbi:MAG: energy-coupling factor transporter transmembrane component T [Elainellaceae cyanobacterium]
MKLELDQYTHLDSPLHRWHPTPKLVGFVVLIFAFAGVKSYSLLPAMLGVTLLLYWLSRLPLSYLQGRLRYPGLFLIGIVGLLPFLSGSTVIWQWGWLTVRSEGLWAALLVSSRFLAILTTSFILIGTTPFLSLIDSMRSLGLPAVLADMTLLAYRYLNDIVQSLATMQQAMRLRGFGSSSKSKKLFRINGETFRRLAFLAGTLLIRSYEQAERVYNAMRLRGYGTRSQRQVALRNPNRWGNAWSWAALGLMVLIAIGFFVMEWKLA